uniref:Uncharacterized protein n=1 Tax=Octopus bimaculoides TaxID=37653 RepID=A0A0L8GER5_OCTBM
MNKTLILPHKNKLARVSLFNSDFFEKFEMTFISQPLIRFCLNGHFCSQS